MVMKDKLVKNNHKGSYYLIKKVSIAFFALACFSFAIAIPTYIASQAKKKNIGIAQETSSEVVNEAEEENSSEYESYND